MSSSLHSEGQIGTLSFKSRTIMKAIHTALRSRGCGRSDKNYCRQSEKITIIDRVKKAGHDTGPSTRWTALMQLIKLNIITELNSTIAHIKNGMIEFSGEAANSTTAADTVVFTGTVNSDGTLIKKLRQNICCRAVIGYTSKSGDMLPAVKTAYTNGVLND